MTKGERFLEWVIEEVSTWFVGITLLIVMAIMVALPITYILEKLYE